MEMSAWTTCNYGTQQRQTTGRQHGGETVSDQEKRGGKEEERDSERERSERAPYWLRGSVVSCGTAQLARFTDDTHQSWEKSSRFINGPPCSDYLCHPGYLMVTLQDTDLTDRLQRATCSSGTAHNSTTYYSYKDPATI